MWDFFRHFFDTTGFPPRWYCGTGWSDGLGWLHIGSDIAIWGAYTAIPLVLGFFYLRRRDLPFTRVGLLFALFILACGTTHLVEAMIFWWPAYRVSGLMKLVTATVSWATVAVLIPLTPRALQWPGLARVNQELQVEVGERQRAMQQLRASEQQLQFALAAAEMGTWRVDLQTGLVQRDASLNNMFGLEAAETTQPVDDFLQRVHPQDRPRIEAALRRTTETQVPYDEEIRILCPDESIRWVRDRGKILCDESGTPQYMTGGMVDIHARKLSEQRLEAANSELQQKQEEMEQFVYTVSHDLKSPLVTTMGFIGLLREDLAEGRLDEAADSMARVERATQRMTHLIDDLLELSRIGRIPYDPEPIEVQDLVARLREDLQDRLSEYGGEMVIVDALPAVIGDPVRLEEVFENYLSNAVKYAGNVPAPRIEVGAVQTADEIRYFIRDNGPGIAPQYHQKIFGLFQRLHNDNDGTGVGLAIVARIMQVHGGRAWVESAPGEGATFWLSLPASSLVEPAHATKPSAL